MRDLGFVEMYKDAVVAEVVAKVGIPEGRMGEVDEALEGLREMVAIREIMRENGWGEEEVSLSIQRQAGKLLLHFAALAEDK